MSRSEVRLRETGIFLMILSINVFKLIWRTSV